MELVVSVSPQRFPSISFGLPAQTAWVKIAMSNMDEALTMSRIYPKW